ncbi:MAG: phosphoglycerate kinase [Patescibacteria group bacterium]
MNKKTIRDIDLAGKTVLHHCDFNIKLKKNASGEWVPISDVRLKVYFPSIFYLLEKKCKILFISYLERPGGKVVESLRMGPVAKRLSQLINREVKYLPELFGPKVKEFAAQMKPGEMVMLENTRFYPGEEEDDDNLAKKIAENADLMVEDAFGHCHRVHASTTGIPRHIPSVAGLYLEGEVQTFEKLLKKPERPLVLIVGGTKTYDKIMAIKNLIDRTDKVLIGGAAANNFLKAQGMGVGGSFLDEPYVDKAKGKRVDLIEESGRLKQEFGDKIVLPEDMVAGNEVKQPTKTKVIRIKADTRLPGKWAFLDIGPKTIEKYMTIIKQAKTIFWDGPMGKYEDIRFRQGTLKVAEAVAENGKTTILGGGDTAALTEDFGLIFRYSHVSVAGGATLEFLSGKPMPGIEALMNK